MISRQFLPALLWTLLILLVYGIPGGEIPSLNFWDLLQIDKVIHFSIFALHSAILITGFRKQTNWEVLRENAIWVGLVLSIVLGAILEGIQGMVFVDRVSDWLDFIANCAGALVGVVIIRIIYGNEVFSSR
jgi:VanZ family protein